MRGWQKGGGAKGDKALSRFLARLSQRRVIPRRKTSMFKIKSRVASIAALAVLTLPVLAACGGETATSTAVPAPTGTTAPAAAATDTPAAAAADTPATSAATPTEAVAGMA